MEQKAGTIIMIPVRQLKISLFILLLVSFGTARVIFRLPGHNI
jgi:hypothetical protein